MNADLVGPRSRHRACALLTLMGLGFGLQQLVGQEAPSFPTLPTDVPAGEGATQPCLETTEGTVLCGRFRVYENRTHAEGRTIDLAFVVLRALKDEGHTDAFIQFNGGPGASTTPVASAFAGFRADVRESRDILLVDARGTGNSAALRCDNPYPGGVASRFETVFPLDHVDGCREMLSRRADLSQYTTPHAMDDLAELATWLGYSQLNLNGGSYGTREAQIFTRRHPDMVRTVILNGVAPVESPLYVHHARYLQGALENLFDECEAQPTCQETYPALERATQEVLERATRDPAQVMVQGVTVPFRIGPLSYALRGLLYGQSGTVPARIFEARSGNWQPLADYYLARQSWVGAADGTPAGYHYSVLCAEDVDPLTWPQIARETAGTFMGDYLIGGYKRACERWPSAVMPDGYFEPVHSNKPALILSGGRDPVTPVSGGTALASGWPNSLHVIVPNGGHGQGGACINQMMTHLIETGSVDGIDTSCVRNPPATRFELPGS